MPVHSESRQPRTSSSSASPRRSSLSAGPSSSSFTRLLQPGLDRVAVDAAVLQLELVRPIVDDTNLLARREPRRNGLAAAAVLIARPRLCELRVRRVHRTCVLEGLPLPLLPEDLPDHATSTMSRTHCSCSRKRRRSARRSSVCGPCPVTTCISSSQSGSLYCHTPSSPRRSFGSGTVSPSSRICGT